MRTFLNLGLCAVFAFCLAACGGDSDSGEGGGGGAATDTTPGVYKLDTESIMPFILKSVAQSMNKPVEELSEGERMMAKEQVAKMSFQVELKADGNFQASGQMGPANIDAKGTWKREGDKVSITTTWEDGKEKTEPETKSATMKDGAIHIQEEGMPFTMVLRK